MNVVVINFAGNQGKTTVSRHLLLSRLPRAQYLPVETINDDVDQHLMVSAKKTSNIVTEAIINDNLIVDVGSSNALEFTNRLEGMDGAANEFGFYIVPVIPGAKAGQNAISTVARLRELDVEPRRIIVIRNEVDPDGDNDFHGVEFFAKDTGEFIYDEALSIRTNEVFDAIRGHEALKSRLVDELAAESVDAYREQLRNAPAGSAEKLLADQMVKAIMMSKSAKKNLDAVFAVLSKYISAA